MPSRARVCVCVQDTRRLAPTSTDIGNSRAKKNDRSGGVNRRNWSAIRYAALSDIPVYIVRVVISAVRREVNSSQSAYLTRTGVDKRERIGIINK